MMTSLAQPYSPHPGGLQQHPGVPQGHPMAGVQHNPGQQVPGQPGMPQQMHMGVSGPGGPQVSQAGAMMGGMPPGAGGPSAHALQHLNPGQAQQAQMYQQQQAMAFANNPQMQQLQQQQIIQHQRQQQAARQAMMAQQYSGIPMGVPNGMNQMTPAQFAAMRSGPMARSVNLPQHLQQAQQQAQHSLEQQQAQQHAQQQHQQQLMAQQMAMQQQANAQAQGGNNPGQQGQMNQQQIQSLQQAQIAAAQQLHQQAQAQAAAAAQQNQGQSQPQPQAQQTQPNPQAQQQQTQPQAQQQQSGMAQQQATMAAAMLQQQQRQGEKIKGQCLMRLMQFGDHLSNFGVSSKPLQAYMANGAQRLAAQGTKQRDDLNYWLSFVDRFFSPKGVLRHSVWIVDERPSNKQYEITFPALARYFHTHFESGINNMQMIMEKGSEKELPNNGHYIESQKASFVYWFDNGSQLIASGSLRAHFDAEQKIELLEFTTSGHEEYLPRTKVIDAARPVHEWGKEWHKVNALPEGKQSPEMNKKKAKPLKSPPQPPPEIDLPQSKVKPSMGITPSVFQFLELAEVMGQMNPLFNYSHLNASLTPHAALDQYVATVAQNINNANNQAQIPAGPRTPGMSNFPLGTSPATAHLHLPDGSPRISGSPAQAPGMQLQQSQHGTSSSGPSANTSPNANKRRRPSTVKAEEEGQVNGTQAKATVKPSPRLGGKRQKGNPA